MAKKAKRKQPVTEIKLVGEVIRVKDFPVRKLGSLVAQVEARAKEVKAWQILEDILPDYTDKKTRKLTTVHVMGPTGEVEPIVRAILNLKK